VFILLQHLFYFCALETTPLEVVDYGTRASTLQVQRKLELTSTHAEIRRRMCCQPALKWTHGHRGIGRPKNTWKRDLEKEINGSNRLQIQLEQDGHSSPS